ncbi:glycerate kinase family protein [Bacteroides sp.]
MKKIVIASDSFKGSLSSLQVADAIEEGIYIELPEVQVIKIPVADGGEGTMQTLVDALHGDYVSCRVKDPLMRDITSSYGIVQRKGESTAIIDMASASGITLLSEQERNPLITTTYGTGQLIADAHSRGCRHFIIGIGGSATNDAGKGMLEALGYRFLDADGKRLAPGGESLNKLSFIDVSEADKVRSDSEFTIICDVCNPLFGAQGAAHVFAPQKGASPKDVEILDGGLRKFADCVKSQLGVDMAYIPGSGAAGGLGAAFIAFFNATLKPGIDTILEAQHFEDSISDADLIITGEGKVDEQTLMGKVPQGVLALAQKQNVPVVVLSGAVENRQALTAAGFLSVFCIQSSAIPLCKALEAEVAIENLRQTTSQIVRLLSFCKY